MVDSEILVITIAMFGVLIGVNATLSYRIGRLEEKINLIYKNIKTKVRFKR